MVFLRGDPDFDRPDEGCQLAKSCLQCPFERCLEEEPGNGRQQHRAECDARIWAQSRAGKGSQQIAAELGVSQRTVQRSLARERKASSGGNTSERDSLSLEGRGPGERREIPTVNEYEEWVNLNDTDLIRPAQSA